MERQGIERREGLVMVVGAGQLGAEERTPYRPRRNTKLLGSPFLEGSFACS